MFNRTRIFRSLLLGVAITLFLTVPVLSNQSPITMRQIAGEQVAMPDMENWTFGSMPTLEGQSSTTLLNLRSLSSLRAEQFTLEQTATYSGKDANNLTLVQFPLASEQTLSNLVLGSGNSQGVPYLEQYAIGDVSAIANLLQNNFQLGTIDLNQSLGEFVQSNPLVANLKLNELGDLSQIRVGDIPNLANTPFKDFPDWDGELQQINPDATLLENIPGLQNIPLSQFPNPLNINVNAIARIDTVRGTAEARWQRTVTGSDLVGFEFPCIREIQPNTTACSHLELIAPKNVGDAIRSQFNGRAWINGQHQWVEGGYGLLKNVVFPGLTLARPGLEPTGRLPFGDFVKLVLWEVDETTDSAQFVLFFRYCNALGCTPYNIGPVPFMTYKRNAMIPIGDPIGELNANIIGIGQTNAQSTNRPIQTEQKLAQQQTLEQNPINSGITDNNRMTKANLGDGVVTGKEVAGGISPTLLAGSAMSVLGRGQDSTTSPFEVPVTCVEACGRTLGRYNLHSTHPKVVEAISQKAGGEAFLENLTKPGHPTTTELRTFFPTATQNAVMRGIIDDSARTASSETDPTTGELFCGDRLVERTAQILAGGIFAEIDSPVWSSNVTLTVQDFGQIVQSNYSASGGITASCQ